MDEVELSLLNDEERHQAGQGFSDGFPSAEGKRPFSPKDKKAMLLLIILCKHTILLPSGVS
jgi:hypothetical protein